MQLPNLLQHQSHLWIGNQNTLQSHAIGELQQIFCKSKGCAACSVCTRIQELQHPWVHWLKPDGSYTLDQIDEILTNVRFKLDPKEQRFFIFTQADELTANCNNRLLKTIEEPHEGYFFIFLATRTDTILPTLMSRCFVKEFDAKTYQHQYDDIVQPFLTATFKNPSEFIKLIDKNEITQRETKDIIDLLIQLFHQRLRTIHTQSPNQIEQMLAITHNIVLLKQALLQLPPQGSAKLFWKNLYMTFHYQQT